MAHSIDDVEAKVEALNTALAEFMRQDAAWKAMMDEKMDNHLKHHEQLEGFSMQVKLLVYGALISALTAGLVKLMVT